MILNTVVITRTLVFNDRKQLLLLVRSNDDVYRAGGFDLPGGAVDAGEELAAGAARELLEETGLVVDPAQMILFQASSGVGHNVDAGGTLNMVKLFFVAQVADPTVMLSSEHQAHHWYTLEEAIAQTDHPNHKVVLEYLRDNNIATEYWS